MTEFVFDVEADNFFPAVTKTWVIVIKSVCGFHKLKLFPFRDPLAGKKFFNFFSDGDTIIGHNILGYDFFTIMKTMKINFEMGSSILKFGGEVKTVCVVDTLCLSRFINPDQHAHSLEWWGKKFNFPKIDFHDFANFSHDMVVYCERDVDLTILVYAFLKKRFEKLYQADSTVGFDCYQYDYYLMCCQGITGVLFNLEKAIKIRTSVSTDIEVIRARVEPQLPPRALNKGEQKDYTMPKKPFKKNGDIAASTYNFIEKMINFGHECSLISSGEVLISPEFIIEFDGKHYPLKSQFILPLQVPMTLSNQGQLKDWLLELGWKPTFWNFKKDSNGQFIRSDYGQLIKTTPKLQEQGKICENLESINLELVKDTCKWLSLRNRNAVLTTWIANPRLELDGRLSSRTSGTTPTYRQKHTEVVNVPKAQEGVLYGKEFRSLFYAPEGRKFVGADASGLEARVDGHYCAKTDGGERADIILNGDIHSVNAKLFFPEETKDFDIYAPDFDKDHPDFKPYRSKSKNAAYALAYGCGVKKLAQTLGKPASEAQALYDAFWEGNPALKAVKHGVTRYWKEFGGKRLLLAIDGRMITTRKESALVNSLFQSCGAIIMAYSGITMDKKLGGIKWDENYRPYYEYKDHIAKRVLFMHDEFQYEADNEIAHKIGKMVVDSIVEAGVNLNLRLPLDGDFGVGESWAETH